MLVLGLDIATSTGFCLMDRSRPPSAWRCLAIEAEGENGEEKAEDLGITLYELIADLDERPAFAAIEMPQRGIKQFRKRGKEGDPEGGKPEATINPNALQLSTLAGGAVSALGIMGIPWGLIAPATWRSVYFGRGYKPRVDWKESALELAAIQKIALPPTQKAARDAAESVGIASSWTRCTLIPARHQAAFMALRTGRAPAQQSLERT